MKEVPERSGSGERPTRLRTGLTSHVANVRCRDSARSDSGCAATERGVDGERGPTEGGADLQPPEAGPSCQTCGRFAEFVPMLLEVLGRAELEGRQLQRERDAERQRNSELEAQVAELRRAQFGRQSVQSKPAEPPRVERPELPTQHERRELPEDERRCPQCGAPFRTTGLVCSARSSAFATARPARAGRRTK